MCAAPSARPCTGPKSPKAVDRRSVLEGTAEDPRTRLLATPNLARWFRKNRSLGSKDRQVVSETDSWHCSPREALLLRAERPKSRTGENVGRSHRWSALRIAGGCKPRRGFCHRPGSCRTGGRGMAVCIGAGRSMCIRTQLDPAATHAHSAGGANRDALIATLQSKISVWPLP